MNLNSIHAFRLSPAQCIWLLIRMAVISCIIRTVLLLLLSLVHFSPPAFFPELRKVEVHVTRFFCIFFYFTNPTMMFPVSTNNTRNLAVSLNYFSLFYLKVSPFISSLSLKILQKLYLFLNLLYVLLQ